jgi:5'-3' exonuclease
MGVSGLYLKLLEAYPDAMKNIVKWPEEVKVNTLAFDLNGIIHVSCQSIFKYNIDTKVPKNSMLFQPPTPTYDLYEKCYTEIINKISNIIEMVKPDERVIIAIDGPAPRAKMTQQRRRRYFSAKDRINNFNYPGNIFNNSSISPGTQFLSNLSEKIKLYITSDLIFSKLEVIFSDDSVPGEGEHKILNWMRFQSSEQKTVMYGADADLISLMMGTHFKNIHILRENAYDKYDHPWWIVDIKKLHDDLAYSMGAKKEEENTTIEDFIYIIFLLGNDFLPHSKGLDIFGGGINNLIELYKRIAPRYGKLTYRIENGIRVSKTTLKAFLSEFAKNEKKLIDAQLNNSRRSLPDILLEKHTVDIITNKGLKKSVNLDAYHQDYLKEHFGGTGQLKDNVRKCSLQYLECMDFVLDYYILGISSWTYSYQGILSEEENIYSGLYAPFASDLLEAVDTHTYHYYGVTYPVSPFEQLLYVLPKESKFLLPKELHSIFNLPEYNINLKQLYVDTAGMRAKGQEVVKLKPLDINKVNTYYKNCLKNVNSKDLKRNKFGKTIVYKNNLPTTNIDYM